MSPSPSPSSPDSVAVNRAMVAVDTALARICAAVAPDAVALVDAWGFTDAQLGHSAIGAADGDVSAAVNMRSASPESAPPLPATAEKGPVVGQHKTSIRRLTQRWGGRSRPVGQAATNTRRRQGIAERKNAGPPSAQPTPCLRCRR